MARLNRGIANTNYPPNVQEKLAEIAARKGVTVAEYLRALLEPKEPDSLADALPSQFKSDPELWALIKDDPGYTVVADRASGYRRGSRAHILAGERWVCE